MNILVQKCLSSFSLSIDQSLADCEWQVLQQIIILTFNIYDVLNSEISTSHELLK